MKKITTRNWIILAAICGLSMTLVHCTSVKNQSLGPKSEFSNEPFVEAYLEFPGPRRLWAGPQTVVIHVKAKDGETPELAVTPAYFQSAPLEVSEEKVTIAKRAISSTTEDEVSAASGKAQVLKVGTRMKMPVAAVRDELADIIDSFEDTPVAATGCAFPVRMKLIRTNGGVLEKVGCRGSAAWTKTASEAASRFLASASYLETQPTVVERAVANHADEAKPAEHNDHDSKPVKKQERESGHGDAH